MSRHLRYQANRSGHAAQVLTAARTELRDVAQPGTDHAAWLYAHRILEADDDWGTRSKLIVQGDAIAWPLIEQLVALAEIGRETHLAQSGHRPANRGDCPLCTPLPNANLVFALRDRADGTVSR